MDPEVKSLRTALGLTQDELADVLGTRRITVARWERGSQPNPLSRRVVSALSLYVSRNPDTAAELGNALRRELAVSGPLHALRYLLERTLPQRAPAPQLDAH